MRSTRLIVMLDYLARFRGAFILRPKNYENYGDSAGLHPSSETR